ncbi:MAG: hypothetical protein COA36_05800 [Desulfotalea sp.]|nr:MAG: hypothetical protein COA36_05800 [Desulfotalea sp.]
MDINTLISSITENVLKQLNTPVSKRCFMVLAERDPLLCETICRLSGEKIDIFYLTEDTKDRTICRYILPFLSCSDMADLAAGRAHSPNTANALNLLLQGKKIEVIEFEHKKYSESAAGPLYSLYESYLKTLAGFGLKEFQQKVPEVVRFWQTLVTEKVVDNVQQQGGSTLMVLGAAKITPLAAEAAKDLNITIQKCL